MELAFIIFDFEHFNFLIVDTEVFLMTVTHFVCILLDSACLACEYWAWQSEYCGNVYAFSTV